MTILHIIGYIVNAPICRSAEKITMIWVCISRVKNRFQMRISIKVIESKLLLTQYSFYLQVWQMACGFVFITKSSTFSFVVSNTQIIILCSYSYRWNPTVRDWSKLCCTSSMRWNVKVLRKPLNNNEFADLSTQNLKKTEIKHFS